jgi:hypothetical protein
VNSSWVIVCWNAAKLFQSGADESGERCSADTGGREAPIIAQQTRIGKIRDMAQLLRLLYVLI